MQEISKEEWADWRRHPMTVEYFRLVKDLREDTLQLLSDGVFSDDLGKQSIAVGKVNALTKVLEASHGEFNG